VRKIPIIHYFHPNSENSHFPFNIDSPFCCTLHSPLIHQLLFWEEITWRRVNPYLKQIYIYPVFRAALFYHPWSLYKPAQKNVVHRSLDTIRHYQSPVIAQKNNKRKSKVFLICRKRSCDNN